MAADVLAVLDELGVSQAHVVGHDWGAALRLDRARGCRDRSTTWWPCPSATPGPVVSGDAGSPSSTTWYMFLFQFEGVAEQWLSADGWANFRAWSHHPDADDGDLPEPKALTPALNWYRANIPPQTWAAADRPAFGAGSDHGGWHRGLRPHRAR